jgi:hypothetical protein
VAAVLLVRGGIWGIVLAVAAVGEYVWDVLPNTPSRTQAMGLSARVISGAFVGWLIATMHYGSRMFGAIAGIAGAVIGRGAPRSDRPHRRLSCRDRGRPPRDRTRSFHRHTLGPACILTPRMAARSPATVNIMAGKIPASDFAAFVDAVEQRRAMEEYGNAHWVIHAVN